MRLSLRFSLVVLVLGGLFNSHPAGGMEPRLKLLLAIPQDETVLKDPLSLCVEPAGDAIYVANTGSQEILVFSSGGRLISRFPQKNLSPFGLALTPAGSLWFGPMEGSTLCSTDRLGRGVRCLSCPGVRPGRMATDGGGKLYLVDRESQAVLYLDSLDNLLRFSPGGRSDGHGAFEMLQDVAVDEKGSVYGVSSLGTAVQIFDSTGNLLRSFGKHGSGSAEFSFPTGIAVDSAGRVWVVDSFQHELKVFDALGNFLFSWGEMGREEGKFFFPVDIAIDRQGYIYVLEKVSGRVQVFELEGTVKTGPHDRKPSRGPGR